MNVNKYIMAFKNKPKQDFFFVIGAIIAIIIIALLLFGCGKPKPVGVEKVYTVKVVFMDNHEDTLRITSTCPPKLSNMCCSDGVGSYLIINCDHSDKVASHVKYFSIISEK
jgi:hypothetical protein